MKCADLLEIEKKYFKERSLYSLFQNIYLASYFGIHSTHVLPQ